MSWLVFGIAFLCVCVGYVLGMCSGQRRLPFWWRHSDTAEVAAEVSDAESRQVDTEQARVFLERLHELTSSVDDDVDRHASRVAEISNELSGGSPDDSTVVLAAATKLIEANKKLQADLASAKVEIRAQKRQLNSYMTEARTDVLTGLANRRAFEQELSRRFAQWQEHETPMVLAILDVDHFKSFNDRHGHQAGDEVLRRIAQLLSEPLRETDMVARYGGEEFAVIFPGTTLKDAMPIADLLQSIVGSHGVQVDKTKLKISVSVGLAQAMETDDVKTLVQRADDALYAAKKAGRNCSYFHNGVTCHPVETSEQRSRRFTTKRVKRIAPFVDGRFPERAMFRELECQDLSATGFSYLLREQPDYESVILALANSSGQSYLTATIKKCVNIGSSAKPVYWVTCKFTSRADFSTDDQPVEGREQSIRDAVPSATG